MSVDPTDSGELKHSGWIALPGVVFRPGDALLEVGNQTHTLTPKASALLHQLTLAYPHAARREQLLDDLWGPGRGSPETIAQVIAELRRKLGDDAKAPSFIRTVPKVGFQLLVEPIALASADPDAVAAEAPLLHVAPVPDPNVPAPVATSVSSSMPMKPIGLALLLIGLAAAGWLLLRPTTPVALAGELRIVADDAVIETMPRVIGSGAGLIYAIGNPDNGDMDIALRALNEARPRIIAKPGTAESSPILSADGRQLALVRQSSRSCQVLLSEPSGRLERVIAQCAPAGPGQLIDMTADGAIVAYTAPTGDQYQSRAIAVIDTTDGNERYRTDAHSPLHTDYGPRLSTDAERLSFFRHDYQTGEVELRLYLNGQSTALPAPTGESFVAHAWSPSDRFFAITSDGSNARLVELELPEARVIRVIARIPDGRNLAFDGERFVYSTAMVGGTHLARFDFATADTEPTRVTSARSGHSLPRLIDSSRTLLFAVQANQNAEIWATELDGGSTTRLASYRNSKLLALQWLAQGARIDALLRDGEGVTSRLQIAFPSGTEQQRQPCAGAQAIAPATASNDALVRDARGRYFSSCADLTAADAASRALMTDAMAIEFDGEQTRVASFNTQVGIWAVDEQLQPVKQVAEYFRGEDFAWAVNAHWYVRLQQDATDPTSLHITRTDLRDGSEIRLAADQLALTAGIEVSAEGQAYAVVNELEDVDIMMLEWREADYR